MFYGLFSRRIVFMKISEVYPKLRTLNHVDELSILEIQIVKSNYFILANHRINY